MTAETHTPEGHGAISGELVRLTMGGRPTIHDMWLSVELGAALARMRVNYERMARRLSEQLMPVLRGAIQSFEAMEPALQRLAKAMPEDFGTDSDDEAKP